MAYTFDPIFAADPNNPSVVASNAAILIYNPADTGKAPVTITDSSGSPLSNPITVNKNGFGPAFQHATLDRLAWQGGGFEGYFTSYEGMKNAALAAQTAAETAAGTAGAEAAAAADAALSTAVTATSTSAAAAAASAASAANAAALVGAPADAAIAAAVNGTGATKTALNAAIAAGTVGKLDKTEAATTYAPAFVRSRSVLGARTVFDGDSITAAMVTTNSGYQNRASGWAQVMARASDGHIEEVYNAGLPGQTSAGALARFDTYVAPYAPQTVILCIGTNDVGQSLTKASWQANMNAYWDKCKAINARLVVGEIWPTYPAATPERGATARLWNVWLGEWARTNDIPLIPWGQLADLTHGGWPDAWTTDQVHPKTQDIATTTIGVFGWNSIKEFYGQAVIKRPSMNGGDLLANGFGTLLTTAIGVPAPTTSVSTASGTLAAGTYTYKVTTRSRNGEGLPSAAITGVLGATGTITVSWPNIGSNVGFKVYRKGPGDSDWLLIQTLATSVVSFVDDGALSPGTATPPTTDQSKRPTGLTEGQLKIMAVGFGARTVAGIRGNVWRYTPYDDAVESSNYFQTGAIAPGDQIEISGRIAGSGGSALGKVVFYFRDASSNLATIILVTDVLTTEFGTFHYRATAPAGTTGGRLYIQVPAGWMDLAELRVEKIN